MPWKIRIATSAKADISEIKKWYKKQSILAADSFINELIFFVESLSNDTIEHKTIYGEYKRLLLNKFPYIIYYKRDHANLTVDIIAVLHNKRDKDIITKRLYE